MNDIFLYRSIKLYIVAAHEAILIDATMYSVLEK